MKLTSKLISFVEHYTGDCEGNGAKAAEAVGSSKTSAKVMAARWLKRPDVQEAIVNRTAQIVNRREQAVNGLVEAALKADRSKIADAAERREFFTAIMRDPEAWLIARIKAADTLNRMDGEYVQKIEHTHKTKPDLSQLSEAELAQLEQLVTKAQPATTEAVH